MSTDVVIAAQDEAATVGAVVDACMGAPGVNSVIVVANGCSDDTAGRAGQAGALVVTVPDAGKGNAMAEGLASVSTPTVLFCDADLVGLSAAHVQGMLDAAPYDGQVCGLVDTTVANVTRYLPPITGQRRLPTSVARSIKLAGSGYKAELRIDAQIGRLGLAHSTLILRGVTNPSNALRDPLSFLAMAGSVLVTSVALSPELFAYERNGLG